VTVIQGRVDGRNKVATTRAAWQAAVADDKSERARTNELVLHVRQALLVAFAGDVAILADFGLTPRKRKAPKPKVKVQAAERARSRQRPAF
jgi:hypothetical protein